MLRMFTIKPTARKIAYTKKIPVKNFHGKSIVENFSQVTANVDNLSLSSHRSMLSKYSIRKVNECFSRPTDPMIFAPENLPNFSQQY
jgi:hypothetical protein